VQYLDLAQMSDDDIDSFVKCCKDFVEQTVPSATPGTTQPLGILNYLIGINGQLIDGQGTDGWMADDLFDGVASSVSQAGFEGAASAVAFALDCIEIHRTPRRTGFSGRIEAGERGDRGDVPVVRW
jgi:hypothetical protein